MKAKLSIKQQVRLNRQAENNYARMYGKPVRYPEADIPAILKPKRVQAVVKKQSESEIQKDILSFLKHHPKVAKIWRQNSGTFTQEYHGKTHYIRANTARGMSDLMGILKDGRMLAVEVKSATGRIMDHQSDFLKEILDAGGVAGVCRSVDDAIKLMEEV